ncbi:MAG TPA: hypothetical protein VLE89_02940 [Chlamydiales bacterium]|nr:hypothetical protein [Chlamydiales bacterium]
MPNPTGPTPSKDPSQTTPPPPDTKGEPHYKSGKIEGKPMTFLGMYFDADDAKKLWNVIIQAINNQISKDQARAVAAIKKWGKAQAGEDTDD